MVEKSSNKSRIESLLSTKKWEELNLPQTLIETLKTKLKFDWPSTIQAYIMNLKNHFKEEPFTLVVQSKNGSGKTVSFCLPAITSINLSIPTEIYKKLTPQVLIFCNTNELVFQTESVLKEMVSGASESIKIGAFLKKEANRSKINR